MNRTFTTLTVFAVLAGWTSAQNTGDTAGDRMARFAKNRTLVESLIDRGVDLANANGELSRAEACQKTAADLTAGLSAAANADDPDRVAEIGEYLEAVLRNAVVPALDDGRRLIKEGSPQVAELKLVAEKAVADAQRAATLIPTDGKVGKSARVADVRAKLAATAAGVK